MHKIWFLAAALLLSACQPREDSVITPTEPGQDTLVAETTAEAPQDKARERIDAFVEKNADAFVSYAFKAAAPPDLGKAIQALVDQPKADKGLKSDDYGDLQLPALKHAEALKARYEAQGYAPIFWQGRAPVKAVEHAIDALKDLEERAITPKMLDPTAFLAALDKLNAEDLGNAGEFVLNAEERRTLADQIQKSGVDINDSQAVKELIDDMLAQNALPRLKDAVQAKSEGSKGLVQWAALADVLLADHILSFAQIVKFNNRTHLSDEEKQSLGKKPTEKKYKEIALNRTLSWFEELTKTASPDDFKALWEGLYPVHPQYTKLIEAHHLYRDLPDWPTVSQGRVVPKRTSPVVGKLKLRLAAEGLYKGDVSEEAQADPDTFNLYDNDIRGAVRLYHETHQLEYDEKKGIQKSFWTSLNTSRAERLTQIDENIRRMYSTYLVDSDFYIYVNVPDFHGEVWKDHKLVHRFPVVAGSARRSCDPETKQYYYINATPLMHAHMLYVEYNPYWNVPMRIEQEDYIEKINADPTWLETHGFEYYTEDGHTILRQLPGENNALGRVKFIFPNDHSTFLHDSPQKRFFKYPIRAFSHGCMRVWEPLKLAEILLKLDGQWYDGISTEIEDFQTRRIVFKNRFDVFIDYFTVRMDDDGLVYFLSDPYHYVKDALNPPSAKSLSCKPSNKAFIQRTSLMQGDDVGSDEPAI